MAMDIQQLLKMLSGSGGHPGTQQEPWNPAAKIIADLGMPSMPGAKPPEATSVGGQIGNAVIPQTMAAKGGSSGGR